MGIVLSGFGGATAEGAVVTDNDLSDTGGFGGFAPGIGYAGSTDGVSVIGNVANNCETGGINLYSNEAEGSPQRNTIRDNTALGNGIFGISLGTRDEAFRTRDNLIQSNTAFGNGVRDLQEARIGVGRYEDCLNTWRDNDFDVAAADCIE